MHLHVAHHGVGELVDHHVPEGASDGDENEDGNESHRDK
jgi:hypothetical protein